MRASTRILAFAVLAAFGLGAAIGAATRFARSPGATALSPPRPIWTEVTWPFTMDPWGKGRAFLCKPADCGTEVLVVLRAKLGLCNCATGVANDEDLDWMGDLDLVGGEASPLGVGRPVTVGWMHGRTRNYALDAGKPSARTAISIAFNDRCDMMAATAVMPHGQPVTIEPGVLELLNSEPVLKWVEVVLGV